MANVWSGAVPTEASAVRRCSQGDQNVERSGVAWDASLACDITWQVMSVSAHGGSPVEAGPDAVAPAPRAGAGRIGIWIFLVTDAMGFGALLLAYGVLRTRSAGWPDPMERFMIPVAAAMTLVLLTSSLAVLLALAAADQGRRGAARGWLAATMLCGLGFLAGQAFEYQHLLQGTSPMGLTSGLFASLFYVITGFHGLHVLAGLLVLGVVAIGRGVGPAWSRRVEVAALFWHFVDVAWVAIFTFVYLLPVH
jgi:heme/copper-type cytochrome/quinol oxidase subunit 3